MASFWRIRRAVFAIATGAAIAIGSLWAPIVIGALTPAQAQISEDAQIALEQYGVWRPHPRFGDVWVPAGVPPDWRPYEYGRWVYTDDWGWYWASDDVEANWGWVVYHYGRWAFERGFGWFWVPGDEWAPAWVNWRYGDDYVGWAPLPPDELVGAYEVEPAYWAFVPGRYLGAPRLRTYFVPVYRRSVILRTTNIVNRTVPVHGARLAVNPGIPPAFIARVSGAPVPTYRVRPRVFASTHGVSGAVQINRDELRRPPPGGPPGRPGGTGTAWHRSTAASASGFNSAHHNDDPAEYGGYCAAASRQKRAGAIRGDPAARGSRHNASINNALDSDAATINGSCSAGRAPRYAWRTTRRTSAAAEHRTANSASGSAAVATTRSSATATAAGAAAAAADGSAAATG